MEHALTAQTTLFEEIERGQDRFARAPIRDGESTRMGGGVRTKATALVSGSARIGWRQFESRIDRAANFSGAVWDLNLSVVRPRFVAIVEAQRDLFVSYSPELGRYVSRGQSVYVSAHATPRTEIYVAASGAKLNYVLSTEAPASQFSRTGAGMGHRFSRFVVGVTSEWYGQSGAGAFGGRRVTSYVQYGGGRIRRLDRPLPGER